MISLHSLALTGLLIKLSLYLTAFLDQNPTPLEELRLRAVVPYDASTIQVTDEHNPIFPILSIWKAVEFCLHRSWKHCLPQVTGNVISSGLVNKWYAQPELVWKTSIRHKNEDTAVHWCSHPAPVLKQGLHQCVYTAVHSLTYYNDQNLHYESNLD